MDYFEMTYDRLLKTVFTIANPIKKSIINTQCRVHIHINNYSLEILRKDKYLLEYNLFNNYISDINKGAVWADQDFRSSNHFYNPFSEKGLYGRKTAMDLGIDYYDRCLDHWKVGDLNQSMFYLGAALHIIQDMTIPQHANIRLLDDHRQYETYVIRTHEYIHNFQVDTGAYLLNSIRDYIRFNARVAVKINKKFRGIKDIENRFSRIARCGLPLAKRTTAGAMVMFYNDIQDITFDN